MKQAHDILLHEKRSIFDYAFCIVNKNARDNNLERVTDKYLPDSIRMIYLFDLNDFDTRMRTRKAPSINNY